MRAKKVKTKLRKHVEAQIKKVGNKHVAVMQRAHKDVRKVSLATEVTPEMHMCKHAQLHKALDELVGDFVHHNPRKLPTRTTIYELMVWSKGQITNPTGVL